MQCVAVKKELQLTQPLVFDFLMQFAQDNNLLVTDCAKFKLKVTLKQ
jgi:hypothetical protein